MSRYTEKLSVPVRLGMAGCAPVGGSLFVATRSATREGPEPLLDCLNAATRVLPFRRAGDEATLLVLRAHVDWVLADPTVAPDQVQAAPLGPVREEHVRIRLHGGPVFEGVLAFEMPHQLDRASDFLNSEDDFFALRTSRGTVLVRKEGLLDVELCGAGGLRRAA